MDTFSGAGCHASERIPAGEWFLHTAERGRCRLFVVIREKEDTVMSTLSSPGALEVDVFRTHGRTPHPSARRGIAIFMAMKFNANFSHQYTFCYCSCFFHCRVSQLCRNSMNLPVCPARSRTRHSNHDDCLAAVHGDSTSHTAMLFSLPRPDMKYTVAGLAMWHCF